MSRKGLLSVVFIFICPILVPVIALADFTLNGAGLTSSGSGEAVGTAFVINEGPFYVGEPGFYSDADIDPTGAVAFQQSEAYAWDGTAAASSSGAINRNRVGGECGGFRDRNGTGLHQRCRAEGKRSFP